MKYYLLTLLLLLTLSAVTLSQVPQGIPYQAVARDGQGQPLSNRSIKVRFSILDSTVTGTAVYRETHATTTSALGLFALNVGMGTGSVGSFSTINWGVNSKFLKVELDTTGNGSSYVDLGTQQMMSVPYALYSGKVVSTDTLNKEGNFERLFNLSGIGTGLQVVSVVPPGKKWRMRYSYNLYPMTIGGVWGNWWLNSGDSLFFVSNGFSNNYAGTFEEYNTTNFNLRIMRTDDYKYISANPVFCVPTGKYWKLVSFMESTGVITNGASTPILNNQIVNQNTKREFLFSSGQCLQIPAWGGYVCILEYDE